MLIFQNPTPNPTPLPPALENAITSKTLDTVNEALQHQVTGVLLVVALGFLAWRIGILLQIYFTRNRPPAAPKEDVMAPGLVNAVNAMSDIVDRVEQNRKLEHQESAEREARHIRESAEREAKLIAMLETVQQQRTDESKGHQSGLIKIAEVTSEQTPLLRKIADQTAHFDQMKTDIHSMSTKGSEPVQELSKAMEAATKALTRIEARLVPYDELIVLLSEVKRKLNLAEFATEKLMDEATEIKKRSTASQPVTTIAVDTTPTPQVNLGATS